MIAPATKHILIVEDDRDIAESMANALGEMGYSVTAVLTSGEEAIDRTKISPQPDLVIMDIFLAGALDGIQAGKYIEDQLNLPVIYITGYRDKAAMLEEEGKVPLVKPFTNKDLKTAVGVVFYRLSSPDNHRKISNPQKQYPDLNLNA